MAVTTLGFVNYSRLTQWWLSEFDDDERAAIKRDYGIGAIGVTAADFDETPLQWTSGNALRFISGLRVQPKNPLALDIADKIARKANELIPKSAIADVHFYWTGVVQYWQRCHADGSRERMLDAARSLVAMQAQACAAVHADMPPGIRVSNVGFDVLYADAVRRNDFDGAERLVGAMGGLPWSYRWDCVKADIAVRRVAHASGTRYLRKNLPPECQ